MAAVELDEPALRAWRSQAADRLQIGDRNCTDLLLIDVARVSEVAVRRALGWAFPYRAWATAVGMIPGVTERAASNVMPPDVPGRVADTSLAGHRPGATSPTRARAMLRAAGALHTPIRFAYESGAVRSTLTRDVVGAALRRAGFVPVPVPVGQVGVPAGLRPGPDVTFRRWCPSLPSGGAWIPALFGSGDALPPGATAEPFTSYRNARVTQLIHRITGLPLADQPARWDALGRKTQRRDVVMVALGYPSVAIAHGSSVGGIGVDTLNEAPYLKDVWINRRRIPG